jgi:hypothetical protein
VAWRECMVTSPDQPIPVARGAIAGARPQCYVLGGPSVFGSVIQQTKTELFDVVWNGQTLPDTP